jgi:hypothetical protein
MSSCCPAPPVEGSAVSRAADAGAGASDGGVLPRVFRALYLTRWAPSWLAGVILALLPKCPVCLVAYAAWAGIGVSLPVARHLRFGVIATCLVVCLAALVPLALRLTRAGAGFVAGPRRGLQD